MEGKSPNCGIQHSVKSERLDRTCPLPEVNKQASQRIKSLRENSFQVHAPKLLNSLPREIRNISGCSVEKFKEALDQFLEGVPDEPKVSGADYTPGACDLFSAQPSNSIIDQIRRMRNGG